MSKMLRIQMGGVKYVNVQEKVQKTKQMEQLAFEMRC